MLRKNKAIPSQRCGVATVEFALTAPILFLMILGAFEFSRAYVLYNTCEIAAAEGARQGILPGATAADCQAAAASELSYIGVQDFTVFSYSEHDHRCNDRSHGYNSSARDDGQRLYVAAFFPWQNDEQVRHAAARTRQLINS